MLTSALNSSGDQPWTAMVDSIPRKTTSHHVVVYVDVEVHLVDAAMEFVAETVVVDPLLQQQQQGTAISQQLTWWW
jgi:hypothetical protein